jgi:hypothetical protein
MNPVQNVFSRREMKYVLDGAQYEALTDFLRGFAREDEYGRYTVGNTYYDTPDFELVRRSLERPAYKEKLRTRCYTVPDRDMPVFVELKKKYRGVVYKRRAVMTLGEAGAFLEDGQAPTAPDQILREIDWFVKLYRPGPSMYVAYDRLALTGVDDTSLRLTFDSNIRWRTCDPDLSGGTWGKRLFGDARCVFEVKTGGAMPLWLAEKLSELGIYKTSFSKYGRCFLEETAGGAAVHSGNIIDIAGARGFVPQAAAGGKNGRCEENARKYLAADGR